MKQLARAVPGFCRQRLLPVPRQVASDLSIPALPLLCAFTNLLWCVTSMFYSTARRHFLSFLFIFLVFLFPFRVRGRMRDVEPQPFSRHRLSLNSPQRMPPPLHTFSTRPTPPRVRSQYLAIEFLLLFRLRSSHGQTLGAAAAAKQPLVRRGVDGAPQPAVALGARRHHCATRRRHPGRVRNDCRVSAESGLFSFHIFMCA
jgi:hypothetical protein